MKKLFILTGLLASLVISCKMENPLLNESPLPYGAPQFDKIRNEHYMPAFKQAIAESKAEIDAIVANPDAPTFENTIVALENSGILLDRVSGIFYNLLEADTDSEMQEIAEELSPMMTEHSMYISLNEPLFAKVKKVWEQRAELGLDRDQERLLDKTYKSFVRGGANLDKEDKQTYAKLEEELSLLELEFGKHALAATNAFTLNLTEEADLEGLPQFVLDMGAQNAKDRGQQGWTYDLTRPSYGPFMQYSSRRDLRERLYMAYNTRATDGDNSNLEICCNIAGLRLKIANILGYPTFADYVLEERMLDSKDRVESFLEELRQPNLPAARSEIAEVTAYAVANGFEDSVLQPWDFSYWTEKCRDAKYALNDEMLKPYFRLEDCINAVFGLATRLYGVSFEERKDIPVYHKDVKVYDVKDAKGCHKALFYCDFFPRESKRGGAWMTEFRGQSIVDGKESRPLVSIVCNFSKPTADAPSLLTHDELTTFLHEFGHSLHGMLAEGRYQSLTGTNVNHDFVELPSQIMENWGYSPEWLKSFARDYRSGESIPDDLIAKIEGTKNWLAAYLQMRQLGFGFLDMAWHTLEKEPDLSTMEMEKMAMAPTAVLPSVPGTCVSATFSHIFSGGYASGYYSYKWAEVLEADAFSLFEEKGICRI